uniref:Ald_Xan_dh_C2 domain-containing protein n=1 Tax=Macrostomum lignano TaxID=282301 RepID=A0A1I8F2R7_9PLAT
MRGVPCQCSSRPTVFCQIYVYSGLRTKKAGLRLRSLGATIDLTGTNGGPILAEVDDVASPEQLEEHEKIDAGM